jgi:hypothetical protein
MNRERSWPAWAETARPAPSEGAQRLEIERDAAKGGGTLPEGQGELRRAAESCLRANTYPLPASRLVFARVTGLSVAF